jgi:hypothetical protein
LECARLLIVHKFAGRRQLFLSVRTVEYRLQGI